MWVEIEGEETKVYSQNEEIASGCQGWIVSEVGKHYTVHIAVKRKLSTKHRKDHFPDLSVDCIIDGVQVDGVILWNRTVRKPKGDQWRTLGRQVEANEIRKYRFAVPALTEEETPGVNLNGVGAITLDIRRCRTERRKMPAVPTKKTKRKGRAKDSDIGTGDNDVALIGNGIINEASKQGMAIGAITVYGDTVPTPRGPSDPAEYTLKYHNPLTEKREPFYKMTLRYGPEDLLQARRLVPLEVNIAESEPGLEANNAITLDDSDDEDLDSIFVQGDSITAAPALQSPIEPAVSERSEGPSAAALQAIATLKARREERRLREQLEQELEDRILAGDLDAEEELQRALKRSASMELGVKMEDGS